MQLKQQGKQVKVLLHKPELSWMQKVQELLEAIALLPCEQQEQAKVTAEALGELTKSMTKGDCLTDNQFLEGQRELPFDPDAAKQADGETAKTE